MENAWRTGIGAALWLTVAACLALFAALALASRTAARLAPLLLPYLAVLGAPRDRVWPAARAVVRAGRAGRLGRAPHRAVDPRRSACSPSRPPRGVGVLLQGGARSRPSSRPRLSRLLPPAGDGDRLQWRLLVASFLVLLAGVATGMATGHFDRGQLVWLDHKVLFSWFSLLVVTGVLIAPPTLGPARPPGPPGWSCSRTCCCC